MAKRQSKRLGQTSLKFGADTYRTGAQQRLEDSRLLRCHRRFALSMYSSGLAVEGMLRSLCCLKNTEFDERHDLRKFAVRVGVLGLLRQGRDEDFVALVQAVAKSWRNNLRYADDANLERFLRATGSLRSKDTLKRVCKDYLDDCGCVLRRCELVWQRSRKKNSRKFSNAGSS